MTEYHIAAEVIMARHEAQTTETVDALRRKYETPVFGEVRVWELVEMLAQCIDPSDGRLFCASQQVHVLQMLDAMERDGVDDDELLLATLIHDCGKVLLLTDEDPANIVVHEHADRLVRARRRPRQRDVPVEPRRVRLLRVSSSTSPTTSRGSSGTTASSSRTCEHLMDERDRDYYERFLKRFFPYDHETKTPFVLPRRRIDDYRDIVEEAFPKPIRF